VADEAKAQQATADAQTSALTLAQTKYKSLVPDLTSVATNTVDDKSAGVAFSGLVTYSALHHAAEIVASRISAVLPAPADGRPATILVTSQSDLLTNDLLSSTVADSVHQLLNFTGAVLAEPETPAAGTASPPPPGAATHPDAKTYIDALTAATAGAAAALAGGAAVTAAGLGPIGLGAAAVAAIPSIISLFSSTTTVKDHAEDITDLATTAAVVSAVAQQFGSYTVVHDDFRLAPEESPLRNDYRQLMDNRTALVFKLEQVQKIKNDADFVLSRAQQDKDAAGQAKPPRAVDTNLDAQVPQATKDSADAAAALSVISGAITSIDAFTAAVNATAVGTRSPLAVAVLSELLRGDGKDGGGAGRIGHVLSVKGLGGESVEYTKDRHIGIDTYTTLADAPVAFMLYDLTAQRIISSGIANGVSSVHGHLGKPPVGLIGPNAADAVNDADVDQQPVDAVVAANQQDPAAEPHQSWWSRWRQIFLLACESELPGPATIGP